MCVDIFLCSGICVVLGGAVYFVFANFLNYTNNFSAYTELLYLYDYYECGPKQVTINSAHFIPACIILFGFFIIYDLELLYLLLFIFNINFLTSTG